MKANELMIGDYVSVKPSGMLIKIAAVHHKKVAYHTVVHKLSWVREGLLEPIPLTPEILEKNGFEFMTGLWYLTTKERKPIQIVFKDNNVITLSINATPVPIGLKYVHQLQHALRLRGIDKEIEL